MSAVTRLLLIMLGVGGIGIGGVGIQQPEAAYQGGGMLSMLLGTIALYFVTKMIWRSFGCLLVLGILAALCFFVMSSMGMLKGVNIGGVDLEGLFTLPQSAPAQPGQPDAQQQGAAQTGQPQMQGATAQTSTTQTTTAQQQGFSPDMGDGFGATVQQPAAPVQQQAYLPPPAAAPPAQPAKPVVTGVPRVINGDTLQVNRHLVRLFGIDAPESNQMCSQANGRSYHCGRKAAAELRQLVNNKTLTCEIMQQNSKGHIVGVCSMGPYDLGAALVSMGWAVAYRQYSTVYAPYEEQAKAQQKGLWAGQFFFPWDWREQRSRKPKIKVLEAPKAKKKSRPKLNYDGAHNVLGSIF